VASGSGNNGALAVAGLSSVAPGATTPAGSAHTPNGSHGAAPLTASGGGPGPGSTPDPVIGNSSGPSQQTFPYFPLIVLDNNNGVVLKRHCSRRNADFANKENDTFSSFADRVKKPVAASSMFTLIS